ncbi:MAG: hypothetical protein ACJ8AD_10530 [Gemmatimonadaceae bacterium]
MTDPRVPRRTFLATAAATVAGASLGVSRLARAAEGSAPTRPRAAEVSPSAVRLGVASYSLRKFPLDKSLEMIKALRTPYVNFKSVHVPYEKSPQELATLRTQIYAAFL